METIKVSVETTVNYEIELEVSDKNYEKWENGEIDGDELLDIYEEKLLNTVAKEDLNSFDADSNFWME